MARKSDAAPARNPTEGQEIPSLTREKPIRQEEFVSNWMPTGSTVFQIRYKSRIEGSNIDATGAAA